MHERATLVGFPTLFVVTLFAAACSDVMGPETRGPEVTPEAAVVTQDAGEASRIAGAGALGTGTPTAGSDLVEFDLDVASDLTGRFFVREWSIERGDGTVATITVSETDAATGITAVRDGSAACADPTRGLEFDGTGRIDTGELAKFSVRACDNGPADSGADLFEISIPGLGYVRRAFLSSGDILKTTVAPEPTTESLTVTTATSGSDLDSDGYTVTVDGITTEAIAAAGSLTFSELAAGEHTVAHGFSAASRRPSRIQAKEPAMKVSKPNRRRTRRAAFSLASLLALLLAACQSDSLGPDRAAAPDAFLGDRGWGRPAPTTSGPPVLVGAGDIAGCATFGDELTAALLDHIPGTVFTTGDNAYPNGSPRDFHKCYDPTWGRHKDRTRPTPGNHEYITPGALGYFEYFREPAGPVGLGYCSYDVSEWHIIALNSMLQLIDDPVQQLWLRADLAQNPRLCTLAYWHHPRFSSARHGSNPRMDDFWQILYEAGADVVLNGHDHVYERFAPQSPVGEADPENGIRRFTVGTGGRGLYEFRTRLPNSEVRFNLTFGVLKLELDPAGYTWTFIVIPGIAVDSGSDACH